MAITITDDQRMTKYITIPDAAGNTQRVATMTGRVTPNASMTMTLMVTDHALAAANATDIAAALDTFVAELRTMAAENGLPT